MTMSRGLTGQRARTTAATEGRLDLYLHPITFVDAVLADVIEVVLRAAGKDRSRGAKLPFTARNAPGALTSLGERGRTVAVPSVVVLASM